MTREELLSRITIDPKVCFGKPSIRGHRIWVSLILDLLASGMSSEEILDEYPGIEEADIRACIAYGAEMAREGYVETSVSARTAIRAAAAHGTGRSKARKKVLGEEPLGLWPQLRQHFGQRRKVGDERSK